MLAELTFSHHPSKIKPFRTTNHSFAPYLFLAQSSPGLRRKQTEVSTFPDLPRKGELNQKAYLCAFLDHGEVELSKNQVENALRPLVVGRKGWLFCDTPEGTEATAVLYTILETAKANHLNPETYLRHLLATLQQRQASKPKWIHRRPSALVRCHAKAVQDGGMLSVYGVTHGSVTIPYLSKGAAAKCFAAVPFLCACYDRNY